MWTEKKTKYAIALFNEGKNYKEIAISIGESKGATKMKMYRLGYKFFQNQKENRLCLHCGATLACTKKSTKKFCNNSCSASYNNKNKKKGNHYEHTKLAECIFCKKNVFIKKNLSDKDYVCSDCKCVKKCISCGCVIGKGVRTKYCSECKKFIQNADLFKKLNVQNDNLQIANVEALKILSKEYFTNKKSTLQIKEEYGIMLNTFHFFFKKNGVDFRTLSKSQKTAVKEGRSIPSINKTYKNGNHTTWYGKEVFYRSSYEKRMMDILDDRKELYFYETLRIQYEFKGEMSTHITDFYLPGRNLVIETKGEWFQKRDKERLEAKKMAVISEGYYHLMFGKIELEQYEKGKQL